MLLLPEGGTGLGCHPSLRVPMILAPIPRELQAWLHRGTQTPVLFLCRGSVCAQNVNVYNSLIAPTNRLNLVGFTFNDQSYFKCNLMDKIFNFCLLPLDECQTAYVGLILLAINI